MAAKKHFYRDVQFIAQTPEIPLNNLSGVFIPYLLQALLPKATFPRTFPWVTRGI
jgi:hypothetical protein